MANRRFTQFFYTLHQKPVLLDCVFKVASTDTAGYGITGLKGPGIANVFMHTTQTAATGNPNPAAGFAIVALQDNYNKYFGGFQSIHSPNSGTDIVVTAAGAHLVVGTVYIITTLGTTTAANWITMGLPVGITAAVGVPFVAKATGAGTGSGKVQVPSSSYTSKLEIVGDPQLTLNSSAAQILGSTSGSYLMFQFLAPSMITQSGATHTTTTIDGLTSTAGMAVGMSVMGTGIPLGATVATIASATSITISAAATATATVTVTVGPSFGVPTAPQDGTYVHLGLYLSNSGLTNASE